MTKRYCCKSPKYRYGVQWIADNDEPSELDLDAISGYISTLLLADMFGLDEPSVASDILDVRRQRLEWDLRDFQRAAHE
jgi:hypothetical protein